MTFRSAAGDKNVFATTLSVAKPPGLSDGDLAVVAIAMIDTYDVNIAPGGITPAAGFALAANSDTSLQYGVAIYAKKIASAAGEPSTWDFTLTSSFINHWFSAAFSGVDVVGPGSTVQDSALGNWLAASATCGAAGSDLATVVWAGSPVTADPSETNRLQQGADFTSKLLCLDTAAIGAGPTGDKSGTNDNAAWIALNISLEPSGGGGGGSSSSTSRVSAGNRLAAQSRLAA